MSDKKKNRSLIVIVILIILLLVAALAYIFIFKDKDDSGGMNTNDTNIETDKNGDSNTVTPLREFVLSDSAEAIAASYEEAKVWASDAKLYNCSGLATSMIYDDITYEYVGYEFGKYYKWLCTYYSPSKRQTIIYDYDEGTLTNDVEAMDIGEYSDSMYNSKIYPEPASVTSSAAIFANVINNGANNENNYLNMYLNDTSDYGYAWVVYERSRTEVGEYDIAKLVNVYVLDPISGELIAKVQEEVY